MEEFELGRGCEAPDAKSDCIKSILYGTMPDYGNQDIIEGNKKIKRLYCLINGIQKDFIIKSRYVIDDDSSNNQGLNNMFKNLCVYFQLIVTGKSEFLYEERMNIKDIDKVKLYKLVVKVFSIFNNLKPSQHMNLILNQSYLDNFINIFENFFVAINPHINNKKVNDTIFTMVERVEEINSR